MYLKDLKPGMKGIGRTVILGREIETFDVEILGVLSNNKINEKLLISGRSILARVSGKTIERAGGIAAGMSGSPVFIDGKLVGGLSSGWMMTDHTIGMITPIEEMIEIWNYPTLARSCGSSEPTVWVCETPVVINGMKVERIWEARESSLDLVRAAAGDDPVFVHVSTPILVQGIAGRGFENLKSRFKSRDMRIAQYTVQPQESLITATTVARLASDSIQPGSAIGIQLARGDINVTTLGTLTHKSDNKILALAHPFLKKGSVSFLLTGAHIYHSFSSVEMPFKIGAPTEMIGIINQDREKGVSGEIGKFPEMVPVKIDVVDRDLNRTRSINFQIVRDPSVFVSVIESTMIQALESVIDREGQGTARMGIALECANKEGKTFQFRRENMFFSRTGIVEALTAEIGELMRMIIDSEIEEVFPERLLLRVETEKRRRTMTVEKVEVRNTAITPGGVLDVSVTLRPYRDKTIVRRARIPIPADIGRENLVLTVSGLNIRVEDMETSEARDARVMREGYPEEPSSCFEANIRSWVNSPKNSDLLFQLSIEGDEPRRIRLNDADLQIQPTSLVVLGRVDTTISLSED